MSERCVLAYSGGLDTSVAARSLREERGLDVVAAFVDLGQPYDLGEVKARAGAAEADLRVIDARDRFAEEFCLPALHANALYEGTYPLVSSLARPLIAHEVVALAREVGARFVAHGCTGKGNDQVRFETSFAALAPELEVLAPIREASRSREESLGLAARWGIPQAREASTYSVDENLWGRTVEAGPLEDPWLEPPRDAFELTVDPLQAPDAPAEVTIALEAGRPVALDGARLPIAELVARLNGIAGAHGFGRVDMIENRLVGIKSRELYEVPGALALITAHRDLEDLTLERDLAHEKAGLERRWAELCYYGQWYGPLHEGLRSFMAAAQEDVTGEVRLRFFKGSCAVIGRRSPRALYDLALATYEGRADRFDQGHAEGFIRLWSLPVRTWAGRRGDPPPASRPEPVRPGSVTPHVEEDPASAGPSAVREPPTERSPAPLWGGRFGEASAADAVAFTRSQVDRRLVPQDLRATRAHCEALARAGLLEPGERDRLVAEVDRLLDEAERGSFPFRDEDEDVHLAVERVLTERLGDLGARVHAGRSRNDLVVTDLRLWVGQAATGLAERARGLARALADRAEEHLETPLPAYTHLQRAQPSTLAQHLLAHAFPLVRDAERLERAGAGAGASALGAAAAAGTTLPLDRDVAAAALGLSRSFDNSIDAVSDRDFALDLLSACLSTALHLSRLGEDLVLWCSREFGFARPADAYATGSSMMPQKRNPDVAELARAQAGRILGDLVHLATVLKGLPLSYDRDLQEDKAAVFDAHDALVPALEAMAGMVRTLSFDVDRMAEAAGDPDLSATDVAEHLVARGVPFREAHGVVGRLVARLEEEGRSLRALRPEEWAEVHPALEDPPHLSGGAAARPSPGGPSPASTREQLARLRAALR
ncbi:MAG TPA: argininosuccinate synthase [Actinomycetota bacterium]